jgi:CheY-like chemotaxis protein
MLASVLQFWGFEVRTAHTAQAALALAAEWRPDAAVLDIGLPNASGNDLARRRLRHQPWGRDMLMVAVTGWGHDQDRDRTAEPASMVTWSSPSIRSRCAVSSKHSASAGRKASASSSGIGLNRCRVGVLTGGHWFDASQ